MALLQYWTIKREHYETILFFKKGGCHAAQMPTMADLRTGRQILRAVRARRLHREQGVSVEDHGAGQHVGACLETTPGFVYPALSSLSLAIVLAPYEASV